jgi:pilus assembly protein CpaF
MSLYDRLKRTSLERGTRAELLAEKGKDYRERFILYQEIKSRIHRQLVEKLDLDSLDQFDREALQTDIRDVISSLIKKDSFPLSGREHVQIMEEVENEIFGFGPLEPLLKDPHINDILINTSEQVYIERFGILEPYPQIFKDDAHLMQIIERILSKVGRRVDESSPMVDARLPDGSRVNVIIPPLALDGPVLSIRRFGLDPLTARDLLSYKTLTPDILELLKGVVMARLNIVITGGAGSGKTTLLNVLSSYISSKERIITIEDSAELQLQQEHVVRLETKLPNIEGRGKVTQRDLLINALRMRPDRIIIGEVRGEEVVEMLQAMNTGHDGSISTLHANNPKDAIQRLENMILMAGMDLPEQAMREQISSAINLIIHMTRLSDGSRRIANITEIVGMKKNAISMQDLFVFDHTGIDDKGKVIGKYNQTGIRPTFMQRLEKANIKLSGDLFES